MTHHLLTRDEARRIAVRAQLLDSARPTDLLDLVRHLTRRGITNVLLLEREPMLATGSTGRNAGGVRHQFSTSANILLSLESIGLLERFEAEVGYPIDFHQHGYLFVLSSQASVEAFRRNVELQRSHGVDVDWLTPDRFRFGASSLLNDLLLQLRKQRTGIYRSPDEFTLD